MSVAREVEEAAMEGDEALRKSLVEGIRTLGISIKELSAASDLPASTLYKLLSGKRDPNLKTLRAIVGGLQKVEGFDRALAFVAVVASRRVLSLIKTSSLDVNGKRIPIREYPASSVEDAILATVAAEKDGARALICAPIIAKTVERLVSIPTVAIEHSEEGIMRGIATACGKITLEP